MTDKYREETRFWNSRMSVDVYWILFSTIYCLFPTELTLIRPVMHFTLCGSKSKMFLLLSLFYLYFLVMISMVYFARILLRIINVFAAGAISISVIWERNVSWGQWLLLGKIDVSKDREVVGGSEWSCFGDGNSSWKHISLENTASTRRSIANPLSSFGFLTKLRVLLVASVLCAGMTQMFLIFNLASESVFHPSRSHRPRVHLWDLDKKSTVSYLPDADERMIRAYSETTNFRLLIASWYRISLV